MSERNTRWRSMIMRLVKRHLWLRHGTTTAAVGERVAPCTAPGCWHWCRRYERQTPRSHSSRFGIRRFRSWWKLRRHRLRDHPGPGGSKNRTIQYFLCNFELINSTFSQAHCQFCVPKYLQFSSLLGSEVVSKCEIRCQLVKGITFQVCRLYWSFKFWMVQGKGSWQYWHSCIVERSWKTLFDTSNP